MKLRDLGSLFDKLKKCHKLENVGLSDLVIFVCLALVPMEVCAKYEGFMITHTTREVATGQQKRNRLPLKTMRHIDQIFHVHTLGA